MANIKSNFNKKLFFFCLEFISTNIAFHFQLQRKNLNFPWNLIISKNKLPCYNFLLELFPPCLEKKI